MCLSPSMGGIDNERDNVVSEKLGLAAGRKHRSPHRHLVGRVRLLKRHHIVVAAVEPSIPIRLMQNGDHRLGVNRGDQLIRIARDHREPCALRGLLPEPGDGEHRLLRHVEPHLTFDRPAFTHLVLVGRPFAELGQRHEASIVRLGSQSPPLRQAQIADVGHRPRSAPAEDIPQHEVDGAAAALFADDERLAGVREQLNLILVRPDYVLCPARTEAFEQCLGFARQAGSVARAVSLSRSCFEIVIVVIGGALGSTTSSQDRVQLLLDAHTRDVAQDVWVALPQQLLANIVHRVAGTRTS